MVERRNVVGGGLVAGLAALAAGPPAEAAQGSDGQAVQEIRQLRQALESEATRPWVHVLRIRDQQRVWMRANHKYPDFIEVGIEVWEGLHDWHIRYQQPITMTRTTDGRYVMSFMFTTFILRPDTEGAYVGPPFDGDRRPVPA